MRIDHPCPSTINPPLELDHHAGSSISGFTKPLLSTFSPEGPTDRPSHQGQKRVGKSDRSTPTSARTWDADPSLNFAPPVEAQAHQLNIVAVLQHTRFAALRGQRQQLLLLVSAICRHARARLTRRRGRLLLPL
eukprot:scaffold100664_cov96-Phaeocystis_antarctica.AAC.2